MKYEKGTFVTVPNKKALAKQHATLQALFMWICSFADENGECYPSRATLAKLIKVTPNTIDKYLQQLVDIGFITKEERMKNGLHTSNLYQIMIIEEVVQPLHHPQKVVQPLHHPSATVTPPQCNGCTTGSVTVTHELNTSITKPINKKNIIPKKAPDPIEIEANRVAELFSALNKDWHTFFIPGVQRTSIKKFITFANEDGLDVKKLIEMAKESQGVPYAPQIFTPADMVTRYSKLVALSKKKTQNNLPPGTPYVKGKYDDEEVLIV